MHLTTLLTRRSLSRYEILKFWLNLDSVENWWKYSLSLSLFLYFFFLYKHLSRFFIEHRKKGENKRNRKKRRAREKDWVETIPEETQQGISQHFQVSQGLFLDISPCYRLCSTSPYLTSMILRSVLSVSLLYTPGPLPYLTSATVRSKELTQLAWRDTQITSGSFDRRKYFSRVSVQILEKNLLKILWPSIVN